MSWLETVYNIEDEDLSTLDRSQAIELLTSWLYDDVIANPEGSRETVSRRIVFVFEDETCLTIGADIEPTLSHLNKEMKEDEPITPFSEGWAWNNSANGWSYHRDKSPEELVSVLEEQHGQAKIYLPWDLWVNTIEEGNPDGFVSSYGENNEESAEGLFLLLEYLKNNPKTIMSDWEVTLCDNEEYIPYYASYNKFYRMTEELVASKQMIVVLDEHCGSCLNGTQKALADADPELDGKPSFVTWGQNCRYSWYPDGSIEVEATIAADDYESESVEEYLYNLGEKHGLITDGLGSYG